MIWSGLLIYWAMTPEYKLLGYKLFGDPFYAPQLPSWVPNWIPHQTKGNTRVFFDLNARLAQGMAWHFLFMWIFAINGVCYTLYLVFSKRWKDLVPNRKTVGEALQVVWNEMRFKHAPKHEGRFNGAQKMAYTSVVLMAAIQVVTGLAMHKPAQLDWLNRLMGGYPFVRLIHFVITWMLVAFFFVHVFQVVKTGWACFRAMITGHDLVEISGEEA